MRSVHPLRPPTPCAYLPDCKKSSCSVCRLISASFVTLSQPQIMVVSTVQHARWPSSSQLSVGIF